MAKTKKGKFSNHCDATEDSMRTPSDIVGKSKKGAKKKINTTLRQIRSVRDLESLEELEDELDDIQE